MNTLHSNYSFKHHDKFKDRIVVDTPNIHEPEKPGIKSYNKFIGVILRCFGFASLLKAKDKDGKQTVYYVNSKSYKNWIDRENDHYRFPKAFTTLDEIVQAVSKHTKSQTPDVPNTDKKSGNKTPNSPASSQQTTTTIMPPVVEEKPIPPLHIAVAQNKLEEVKTLLAQKADLNTLDNGLSPLHVAAQKGNVEMMQLLLDHHADINQKTPDMTRMVSGFTPLHFAIKAKNFQAVKFLVEHGADLQTLSSQDGTPLHLAAQFAPKEMLEWLITHGAEVDSLDNEGCTPLFNAAFYGNTVALQLLHDHHANVGAKDNEGSTALHITKKADVAELLINMGAPINEKDKEGITPLHLASYYGRIAVIKILTVNGADIKSLNKKNETVLHSAIKGLIKSNRPLSSDIFGTVRTLMDSGVDLAAKDSEGKTAFDLLNEHQREDEKENLEELKALLQKLPQLSSVDKLLNDINSNNPDSTEGKNAIENALGLLINTHVFHLPEDRLKIGKALAQCAKLGGRHGLLVIQYFIKIADTKALQDKGDWQVKYNYFMNDFLQGAIDPAHLTYVVKLLKTLPPEISLESKANALVSIIQINDDNLTRLIADLLRADEPLKNQVFSQITEIQKNTILKKLDP